MPRVISLHHVASKIFKESSKVMKLAGVSIPNALIDGAYNQWRQKLGVSPWGGRAGSTLTVEHAQSQGGFARVYSKESHDNYKYMEMIENGVSSWDITKALLAGPAAARNQKRHNSKYKFVHVPFRWRTPTKIKPTAVFSKIGKLGMIPNEVYKIVKSGIVYKGEKYPKLQGLKRFGGKNHGKYLTFRTVTENPAKRTTWIHPGHAKTPVYDKVLKYIDKAILEALDDLSKIGKEIAKEHSK